jgi:hypothetical protein
MRDMIWLVFSLFLVASGGAAEVTVCEVLLNSDKYSNRYITVRGEWVTGHESNALIPFECIINQHPSKPWEYGMLLIPASHSRKKGVRVDETEIASFVRRIGGLQRLTSGRVRVSATFSGIFETSSADLRQVRPGDHSSDGPWGGYRARLIYSAAKNLTVVGGRQ